MNQYPLWKYLLIVFIIVFGALYALPNLYGEDPALQVSATRSSPVDEALEQRLQKALDDAGIAVMQIERTDKQMMIRFVGTDDQLKAQDVVNATIGEDYVSALTLAAATPDWLQSVGALPMYLGLDLRGGVHFLMEVDMSAVAKQSEERVVSDLKAQLREEKLRYRGIKRLPEGGVEVRMRDAKTFAGALTLIQTNFQDLNVVENADPETFSMMLTVKEEVLKETRDFALQQNITTLRNRVNELGVAEPTIQQQGLERIVVQLPGIQDPARAKDILGATATLEFRMLDSGHDVQDALDGKVTPGARLYRERNGKPVLLKKDVLLTGDHIIDASSGLESQTGTPAVFITLDGKGAAKFSKSTRNLIGKPMAVVFIENKTTSRMEDGQIVKTRKVIEEVINIATIRDQLGKRFQISGLDDTSEARKLALLLRAGALAAPVEIIEERTIGPSLGQDNIDKGLLSVVIGFVLVLLFMVVYYRTFGLIANLALTLNLVLIVAMLSILQATLTLPGIAGIVLTVGMAVDANVLIFERIREELRAGNSPHASINAGYDKALSTIADANITTLLAAIVLLGFGTGPIKGFAVTLSLGIATSMFTAIMGTRAVVNLLYGGKHIDRLSI